MYVTIYTSSSISSGLDRRSYVGEYSEQEEVGDEGNDEDIDPSASSRISTSAGTCGMSSRASSTGKSCHQQPTWRKRGIFVSAESSMSRQNFADRQQPRDKQGRAVGREAVIYFFDSNHSCLTELLGPTNCSHEPRK